MASPLLSLPYFFIFLATVAFPLLGWSNMGLLCFVQVKQVFKTPKSHVPRRQELPATLRVHFS
jgi:hypothetical protein